jgi:hypothetical protein
MACFERLSPIEQRSFLKNKAFSPQNAIESMGRE